MYDPYSESYHTTDKGKRFCTANLKKWDLVKDQLDFVLLIQTNTLSIPDHVFLFVATLLRGMDCKGAMKIFIIRSKRTFVISLPRIILLLPE